MKQYIADTILSLKRGFPFIAIETSDYQQTLLDLRAGLAEEFTNGSTMALLHHDMARGALAANEAGKVAQAAINEGGEPAVTTAKIEECLQRALDLMPRNTVLVVDDIHLLLEHKDDTVRALYVQCIRNCRDAFKSSQRTLVFLCPKFRPPVELGKDMDTIVAPTPTQLDRIALAETVCRAARVEIKPDATAEVASITRGLTAFAAENLMAMAITEEGFNINILKRGSVAAVNAVPGLKVVDSKMTFDTIMGLDQAKKFGRMKAAGKDRPKAVVLIDEISDQMSGRGDSNGINRDAQGKMLQFMQNCRWKGALFHGVAGTGKTQIAGATANQCEAMFIDWDFGAMKGGIVSESEKMIRNALGTLWDRFGEQVFFIGTTNSVDELTPQMKRRFGIIYFFDVLTADQQYPIWDHYRTKLGLSMDDPLPACDGWTGAEIERCCEYAWEFGVPMKEAAQFITPVVVSMGDKVDKMREEAAGKYLSANYEGYYNTKRSLDLKKMRGLINEPRDIKLN